MDWQSLISDIPDYPKKGVIFKDITPLLANGAGFSAAIEEMANLCLPQEMQPQALCCPEARGFIFASALALRLKIGFIPLRKEGKLPREVASIKYDLEYGSDVLQVHRQDVKANMRVVLIDDILATGGTMQACIELLQGLGAQVVGCVFLLELLQLKGREKLSTIPVYSLLKVE